MPRPDDLSQQLLRKATAALAAARLLAADPDQTDDVVGFHVQQAVEKAAKAVLAAQALPFPLTHDVDFLVRRLVRHDVAVPDELLEARWVTVWGVMARYEEIDADLDRDVAIEVARVAVEWARDATA